MVLFLKYVSVPHISVPYARNTVGLFLPKSPPIVLPDSLSIAMVIFFLKN